MSISEIILKDYDVVTAVSQQSVNQMMGQYLFNHPKDIALYGLDDGNGNISIITDKTKATYILTGTLALEQDVNKNYLNIVQLKTEKGNQTVQYNVTMQNGEFKALKYGIDLKQSDTTMPWIFEFFVNLAMQDIAKKALPVALQQKLKNVDENIFSIQQLYMDLNTASLETFIGINMPALIKGILETMLKNYLIQQQKQNKPLFGVSVHFKNTSVLPPTLTPTYVNFCVTPYHDANGKQTNSNLDTLNYLVMTDHNAPPSYPPKSFAFNWVDDVNIQGVMAIKRKPFADFIVKQLNPILKTLCPVMHCHADGNKSSPNDAVIQLNPGSDHTFNRMYDASTGKIASYSYNTKDSDTDRGPFYAPYTLDVSGNYSMNSEISLIQDKIKISGSITANGEVDTSVGRGTSSSTMPNTTYRWSVELQIYMNAEKNGELDLKIVSQDFNSDPSVEKHDQSWWEKFLNGLGGFMQSYTTNLGDLRGQVKTHILGQVVTALQDTLSNANNFVFPGGKTFAFKNPEFSKNRDLASDITYLTPDP